MTDLTRLRELAQKAYSPLPWHVRDRGIGFEVHAGDPKKGCQSDDGWCVCVNDGFRDTMNEADATLIVEAVNALPALLDENDRLREALLGIIGMHHADPDGGIGYRDGDYVHFDNACAVCGTSDEYAVDWPCSTVLAARAALESSGGSGDG